jgi:membrane protein
MSDVESRRADEAGDPDEVSAGGRSDRAREKLTAAAAGVKSAGVKHVALAVPFRAVERNRRVAASVLAGGIAYKLFLWLLPFGLIVGGALGFLNTSSTEKAVSKGGLPGAITNAIGDASRSAQSDSWWLLAVGVPLLLWAGFTGAKAIQLVHSLVWDEPPPKAKPLKWSLAFTGTMLAIWVMIGATWWVRDDWPGILAPVLTFAPLTALWLWVSLQLPHRDADWRALLPGALLVGIGFQVLHAMILNFLMPKLEKSTSLYGSLGATTTVIFFIYLLAMLVVWAPILNSSLHEELSREKQADG